MHPQNAVERSSHATRLSAYAQLERCLLKGVSCSMCRSRAGFECAEVIGSSDDRKILRCREQVLCRYLIQEVTVGNTDFPNKISGVERAPLHRLTNMSCPVAVQRRQNLLVGFRPSHDRSVSWEWAGGEEFLGAGIPCRAVRTCATGCIPTASTVLSSPRRLIFWCEMGKGFS